MATTETKLRYDFFGWLFGDAEGYVCIATAAPVDARKTFKQHFFHWPTQKEEMLDLIDGASSNKNVWFCVNLLDRPQRKKENCIQHDIVWADLDTCPPDLVEPRPSLIIKSSADRYQGIWKVDTSLPPDVAEDYSKRIAYKYNQQGADPSGWDLTQLLRVPFTKNYKYEVKPLVLILPDVGETPHRVEIFEAIEPAPTTKTEREEVEGMPDEGSLLNPEQVIYKYQAYLERSFHELYTIEPDVDDDWSDRMWKLLNLAFEAGMESQEVFTIGYHAACNKYKRDGRPIRYLWREVVKAREIQQRITKIAGEWEPLLIPELVTPDDYEEDTFIDEYLRWAEDATDAVPIFHELASAILLSGVLAGHIKLEVSWGSMVPNLWGLVLGDSTLSRKTTAMSMATNMLNEIDSEAVLATDGSAEGLLDALQHRPARVSVYYKDEVTGLFDSFQRKNYLAGMPETLTQLYDVPEVYQRLLRKEVITIQKPVFIFFGGGILDRVYSLLSDEYILSGFLPRFLVVTGYADISRIRPTGPAKPGGIAAREKIVNHLLDLKEVYTPNAAPQKVGGQTLSGLASQNLGPKVSAVLTTEAWELYAKFEMQMAGAAAENKYYSALALPTFERLSRSMLKLSCLLAGARQEPRASMIDVEPRDVIQGMRFIQRWGRHSIDLITNAGRSDHMRQIEKVRRTIDSKPGIYRAELMRATGLSSRQMDEVLATLFDRGEIERKSGKGKSTQYWTV